MRTIEDSIKTMMEDLEALANFHRDSRYDKDYNNGMVDAFEIVIKDLQMILYRHNEESEVEE